MDRPNDVSATNLLEALLLPGFYAALNNVSEDDFADYDELADQLKEQQVAFIAEAAPAIELALNRYIDRQLAAPMVPAVRGEDYDPQRLAAIFLDPATSEDELRRASLFGDRPGDEADADTIGTAPNLLAEYCYLLAGNDRAEALALLAVLVGDFDGWAQALAGEDLDTLQRDLKAEAEGERVRHIVKVRVPSGIWNDFRQEGTLDVEVSTVVAEGETVAEAIRSCQLGAPLLEFESPEPWSGPAPFRSQAPARSAGGDPFAGLAYFGAAQKAELAETYADEIADPLWHDIPLLTAQRAHEGTSMVPERRAVSEVARYVQHLRAVRDNLESQAKTDEQSEIAAEEFERYRSGYRQRIIESLGQRSRVLSAMIAGPSKFPTSSNRKRSSAYENGINELVEWSERAQKAAAKAIRGRFAEGGPISSDDPEAVTKIKAEIEQLRKVQAAAIATNKIVRDKKLTREEKIAKMIAAGLNSRNATSALTPDFAGRLGFPSYALSNNTANIRRLEARVEQLTRLRAQAGGEVELEVEGLGDVRVVDSVEDNRLRLYFPGKPSYEVREKLKANGFKWAPSEGAWQRMRGSNALWAAREILGVPNLSALLAASAQPAPEVEEEPEIIAVPVEDTLPEDEAAAELAAEEEMAEAEELADELEPFRGDLNPYGRPKMSVDDRGSRESEASRALSAINEGMTLLRGWTRNRKGADDTEGQWNAVVRAIRGSEATAAAYFYDYTLKGIPAYADRRAWTRWNDANLSLRDDVPSIPFTGRLYYGEMPETAPAPEPPVREVAPGVTAYEFSRMQDDDEKRQAAASLVSQLSPRRAPVAEPEPYSDRDADIALIIRKTFPPPEIVFSRQPAQIDFAGNTIVPAYQGWKLEGQTGKPLAATREEVEREALERQAVEIAEERRRLRDLSRDGWRATLERVFGFDNVVNDYLTETYPDLEKRQQQALAELSKPEMLKEGRKKTDKTFQGTRAEVADQMLKAGYFPIMQTIRGNLTAVPVLKNWQGVFEVKPEVFAFAEWLQERRKRDERALELDGARESARWVAQQERQARQVVSSPAAESDEVLRYTLAEQGIDGFLVPRSLLPQLTANNVPTTRYEYVFGNRMRGMGWGVYQRSTKNRDAGETNAWNDDSSAGHLDWNGVERVRRWGEGQLNAQRDADAEAAVARPWIVSVFGEGVLEPLNITRLSNYLEGRDEAPQFVITNKWLDGLQALGVIDAAGKVDPAKIRAAYRAAAGRTGNPRRRPNPDIGASMVYGYGINQMTPSAPMGASSAVRQARLAAEAERLAQRLARGRR